MNKRCLQASLLWSCDTNLCRNYGIMCMEKTMSTCVPCITVLQSRLRKSANNGTFYHM